MRTTRLSMLAIACGAAVFLSACGSSQQPAAEVKKEEKAVQEQPAKEPKVDALNTGSEDVEAPEVTIDNEVFDGHNVYLRGEMNDYGVRRPYQLRRFEEGKYCTLAALRADWSPYRFKFADAAWSRGRNFGYAEPPAVIREGSAKMLLNPDSRFEELRYELDADGIFRFCIEFDGKKPYATVTRLEKGHLTTMDEVIRKEREELFGKDQLSQESELTQDSAKAQDSAMPQDPESGARR